MDSAASDIPVRQNRGQCLLTQDIFPISISYSASIFRKHLNLCEFLIWAVRKYLLQLCRLLGNTCRRETRARTATKARQRHNLPVGLSTVHPAEKWAVRREERALSTTYAVILHAKPQFYLYVDRAEKYPNFGMLPPPE